MTAKTLKKRGAIDCTRGLSREQRSISRNLKKIESLLTSSCSDGPKSSSDDMKGSGTSIKPKLLSDTEKCIMRLAKQMLKRELRILVVGSSFPCTYFLLEH